MELLLKREHDNPDWTLGKLFVDGVFKHFTCEDELRAVKVRGETRIPAGRYEIKFRKVISGKTTSYRNRFTWFTWHLELQNVPGFQYVYMHIGNSDNDTDGCILVGNSWNVSTGQIGNSAIAFGDFYPKVAGVLNSGGSVWITIV